MEMNVECTWNKNEPSLKSFARDSRWGAVSKLTCRQWDVKNNK